MTEATPLRISITPTPNDREAAAITAAVLAMQRQLPEDEPEAHKNRWREAGKREALRSSNWEKNS